MVNNPPDNPELKLSLQRRFAALRPYAERALSHAAPPPSEATIKQYRAAVDRMEARRLWPEEIGANCRPSFYLYRAGLVYVTRDRLREAADRFAVEATKMNARQAHELLNEIDDCLAVLERYPPGALDEKSRWRRSTAVQVRKSKRRGLGLLPTRWREIMLGACPPNSSYQNAMLVLALTGLRPVELAMGVRVQAIGGGMRITIRGAKVTEQAGQPLRQILFKPEGWIVRKLLAQVVAAGGTLAVSIADPRAFCDFVRGLSRQLFPHVGYVISPYSFRHSFSADQKAAGVSVEMLGRMLGHASGGSQRAYGMKQQGGHALACVLGVAATRPVRLATSDSWDVRREQIPAVAARPAAAFRPAQHL